MPGGVPAGRVELRFEGPGVDARLEVDGLQTGQTMTLTVRLSGSSAARVEDGTDSLVVGGRTVRVDASTRLLDRDNNPIALSAFRPGDFVEAEGYPQLDGSLLAKKVKLEDEDGATGGGAGQDVEFGATISKVSPLVVGGRAVSTNGSTQYLGRRNEALSAPRFVGGSASSAWRRSSSPGRSRADLLVVLEALTQTLEAGRAVRAGIDEERLARLPAHVARVAQRVLAPAVEGPPQKAREPVAGGDSAHACRRRRLVGGYDLGLAAQRPRPQHVLELLVPEVVAVPPDVVRGDDRDRRRRSIVF